jgi:hypothetical protein
VLSRKRQTCREAGTQSQGSPADSPAADLRIAHATDKEVLLPYVIRWPNKRAVALAASCCALLVTAAPAAADTPCAVPQSAPVFSALGDQASYALVPGGAFQDGAAGWTLNNASVVSGGEPWNVSNLSNPQSLNIQPGGSATSPTVCVSSLFPSWRFFAQSADGSSSSQLHVGVQWSDNYGHSGYIPAWNFSGSQFSSWQASSPLVLGSVLAPGYTVNVRFVFTADPNGGAWNIDDVYVDPYAR